ncbi:MAG: hypothetical protein WEB52_08100 [Dehalococcoidia bacterium]
MSEDVFTYFARDGQSEVVHGSLEGRGRIWVRGEYQGNDVPSPLNVRVGDSGIKAWMVILWLNVSEQGNREKLLRDFESVLTREDLENALWFYENSPMAKESIDQRIGEELQPA